MRSFFSFLVVWSIGKSFEEFDLAKVGLPVERVARMNDSSSYVAKEIPQLSV